MRLPSPAAAALPVRWAIRSRIISGMSSIRSATEMPGMSFGHAGTIVEGKEDTASEKITRLAAAGISVAERIEDIPEMISERIAQRTGSVAAAGEGSGTR